MVTVGLTTATNTVMKTLDWMLDWPVVPERVEFELRYSACRWTWLNPVVNTYFPESAAELVCKLYAR